ncbi:hypothetical protein F3Y22_tig00110893pilonHSYRG00774 [Hibiscus syriacus]|uniref:Uncharacterized protein n=1 Tax=Hibiscus syriacus TaxID=106335 RepID=A0A6A2ZHA9_HIBSY|nr:hypothetical protein F3Y22_tig00110893pilonHSYRG00774 [Hibiscus syriacus]
MYRSMRSDHAQGQEESDFLKVSKVNVDDNKYTDGKHVDDDRNVRRDVGKDHGEGGGCELSFTLVAPSFSQSEISGGSEALSLVSGSGSSSCNLSSISLDLSIASCGT